MNKTMFKVMVALVVIILPLLIGYCFEELFLVESSIGYVVSSLQIMFLIHHFKILKDERK